MFAAALAALCADPRAFHRRKRHRPSARRCPTAIRSSSSDDRAIRHSLVLRNDSAATRASAISSSDPRHRGARARESPHTDRTPPRHDQGRTQLGQQPADLVNFIFQKTFIQNANTRLRSHRHALVAAGAIYDLNFFMVERRTDGDSVSFNIRSIRERDGGAPPPVRPEHPGERRRRSEPTRLGPRVVQAGEARLLLDSERHAHLYPRDLSLSKLIEVQAQGAPDAIAVTCGERQLTYAELNASADRSPATCARTRGRGRQGRHLPAAFVEWPLCVLPSSRRAPHSWSWTRRIRRRGTPRESPPRASRRSSPRLPLPVGSAAAVRSIEIEDALAAGCERSPHRRMRAGCRKRRVLPHHPGTRERRPS